MPKHHTGGFFLSMKKIELFGDFAMVAFFCFRNSVEVRLQFFFVAPGGSVNALQHLIVSITAPVGARDLSQSKRF